MNGKERMKLDSMNAGGHGAKFKLATDWPQQGLAEAGDLS